MKPSVLTKRASYRRDNPDNPRSDAYSMCGLLAIRTGTEVAAIMGISRARVNQLERCAIRKVMAGMIPYVKGEM